DGDRRGIILTAAEAHLQPRRNGNDDDVRDDVAGPDPGRLIDACAEVTLNVRQRDVDDRDVDDFEQRGDDDREGDDRSSGTVFDDAGALQTSEVPRLSAVARGGDCYGHCGVTSP